MKVGAITQGIEHLFAAAGSEGVSFETVIVGSGYGGAIAAATLSRKINSICVLERGKEFLPGTFPARLGELAGEVRMSTPAAGAVKGRRDGLFDLRIGEDVVTLTANGLGGGSLINAGVMAGPADTNFEGDLGRYLGLAERLLGARSGGIPNTVQQSASLNSLSKTAALKRLAANGEFTYAPITIAMRCGPNQSGVELDACIGCGDCATGCNHKAKNSLDANLLVDAWRRGVQIYVGATVLKLSRVGDRWELEVVHTDASVRKRQGQPLRLMAHNVILAAGTLGSTEILLRSQRKGLRFSPRLGQQFSANGDMIAAVYNEQSRVNAVADERIAPAEREVGPTITGIVDLRSTGGAVIEDLAVPASLRRLLEETLATAHALHTVEDKNDHTTSDPDPCAIDSDAIAQSQILAVMVDDGAAGCIELPRVAPDRMDAEGLAYVRWPELKHLPAFNDQIDGSRQRPTLAGRVRGSPKPKVFPALMWRPVPKDMALLLDDCAVRC